MNLPYLDGGHIGMSVASIIMLVFPTIFSLLFVHEVRENWESTITTTLKFVVGFVIGVVFQSIIILSYVGSEKLFNA